MHTRNLDMFGVMEASQVKALRSQLGLTQEEFASRLGLATSTVQKWEGATARPRGLSLRALKRLARRSGFPIEN